MLSLEEALERVLVQVPTPRSDTVSLSEAAGRILAELVRSPIDLPPFDNSAMDGYAVRSADVAAAQAGSPVSLHLAGKVTAGQVFAGHLAAGACVRLFTGSPVPPGADAVVMQEDTRLEPAAPGRILILAPAEAGENVRTRGEDVKLGTVLAEAGETLTAGRLGLLAAAGLERLRVGRRPIVGLLATGSELTEPGRPLAPGCIYESNRTLLTALIAHAGAIPRTFPLVGDVLAGTSQALAHAFTQCEAVVTSGGVSVGEMDFLKPALEQIGGRLDLWKVAMRPGRPFVFGRFQEKLLFGLPGNPVSAFVTFVLLVRPALLRWQGATAISLPAQPGVLTQPLANPGARRHFMRVMVDHNGKVKSAGAQASHALRSLAAANGLVDMPPDTNLPAGSAVTVLRWEGG